MNLNFYGCHYDDVISSELIEHHQYYHSQYFFKIFLKS